MSECEQGPIAFYVVPFVPNRRAFVICDLKARVGGQALAGEHRVRELLWRSREADRQMTGWIDLAREDPRDRRAATDARVEGFENSWDLRGPGHENRAAAFDHDDRSRIGF